MTKSTELCSDVTVVIRAAGERTEALCKRLVLQQVPGKQVVAVHERPHNKMLQVSYELGLDGGRFWTLCLDADVLLSGKAIPRLLTLASELGKDAFGMEPRVLDNFFGGDRQGGPHLYRTSLLDKARTLIPQPGESTRPETYVMRQMVARGHDYYLVEDVLSLHDYEQFYRDIYRKMVVQARRFKRVVPYLLSRALFLLEDDLDFKIAAHGLCAGLNVDRDEPLVLDASAWIEEADSLLKECGDEEKARLNIDAYINYVNDVLASYVQSKAYQAFVSQHMQGMLQPRIVPLPQVKDRLRERLLELGAPRIVPWGVGRMLELAGSRLVHWSNKK